MTTKMLLFDIDGTLLLTGGAGKVAFERAFEELFGIPECWGDTLPDGKTDPIIFGEIIERELKRPLSEGEYSELCQRYLRYFKTEVKRSERFRLMPGVPELLEHLSGKKNLLLGIVTGNFEEAAWDKLEQGGLRDHFRFGGFGSDARERRELTRIGMERGHALLQKKLPNDSIFVIGDTHHDILAAKALGVRSVAVTTGSLKEKDLAPHAPDHLFEDLSDLERFLQIIS